MTPSTDAIDTACRELRDLAREHGLRGFRIEVTADSRVSIEAIRDYRGWHSRIVAADVHFDGGPLPLPSAAAKMAAKQCPRREEID